MTYLVLLALFVPVWLLWRAAAKHKTEREVQDFLRSIGNLALLPSPEPLSHTTTARHSRAFSFQNTDAPKKKGC
jgi:hypothetical protein